jgi:predicted hydrocarbon binding protein
MLCSLLEFKSEAKAEVFQKVKSLTGKEWDQLEPEGWYDTKVYGAIFEIMEKHYGTVVALASIKAMGRRIYPTIDKTVGLPKHLKTPLDWLKWENNSFLNDTRGTGVVPRKFIKTEPGHVIVEAVSPGYSCVLVEGLYESILNICGITDYKVTQTRCVEKGDPVCEYDIQWKET